MKTQTCRKGAPRPLVPFFLLILFGLWQAAPCAAQISTSANQLDYGSLYLSQPATKTLTLTNTSSAAVYLSLALLSGDFSYQSNCLSFLGTSILPFPPGGVCSLQVRFNPTTVGKQTQTLALAVYSQSPNAVVSPILQVSFALTGTGLFPVVASPNPLVFGYVLYGHPSLPMPVTLTNKGVVPVFLACGGTFVIPLSPGQNCTQELSFNSTVIGPENSTVNIPVWADSNLYQMLGVVPVTLTGIGYAVFVKAPDDAGIVQIGTTKTLAVTVSNASPTPANLRNIGITGTNFALAPLRSGSCTGTIAPGADCFIYVSYTPTLAVANSGAVTITDDDVFSPQTAQLKGTGSAVKLTLQGPALVDAFKTFDFGNEYLDTATSPSQAILTNTGSVPLSIHEPTLTSKDYDRKNHCESRLPPGASCTIEVSFKPIANGFQQGSLILTEGDPASPQSVAVQGYGIGVSRQTVHVHYDYMVASDHSDDPEALAPGTLERVVQAFAAHNIDLDIDPHHTAIPAVPTIIFDLDAGCDAPDSVNFSSLRARYYTPRFPDEHYVIFSEAETSGAIGCAAGESGEAELPGTDFVVGMGSLIQEDLKRGVSPDNLSFWISGTFMHELGHNLGLTHGGGIGSDDGDLDREVNFKPNYISVMNYYYQLGGIPQASALGSAQVSQCSADRDCTDGASCLPYSPVGSVVKKACYRLDYSSQRLPLSGNTPGALNESNLNEPAGLGSHNTDIFFYSPGCVITGIPAPSHGPVDWDHNGDFTSGNVVSDVDFLWENYSSLLRFGKPADCPPAPASVLKGANDWANLAGPSGSRTEDERGRQTRSSMSSSPPRQAELGFETARSLHVLLPLSPVRVVIGHVCASPLKPVLPYRSGIVTVALLGSNDFDVNLVDSSSLTFHGAKPYNEQIHDINGDGIADLDLQFLGSGVQLSIQATRARLTGWLKNSQSFVGEGEIVMADEGVPILAGCN